MGSFCTLSGAEVQGKGFDEAVIMWLWQMGPAFVVELLAACWHPSLSLFLLTADSDVQTHSPFVRFRCMCVCVWVTPSSSVWIRHVVVCAYVHICVCVRVRRALPSLLTHRAETTANMRWALACVSPLYPGASIIEVSPHENVAETGRKCERCVRIFHRQRHRHRQRHDLLQKEKCAQFYASFHPGVKVLQSLTNSKLQRRPQELVAVMHHIGLKTTNYSKGRRTLFGYLTHIAQITSDIFYLFIIYLLLI